MKLKISDVEFLREKFTLLNQASGKIGSRNESSPTMVWFNQLIQAHATSSRSELKRLERAVQELLAETLTRAQIEAVHAQLRAKYGYHSLSAGATPEDVLKKVLRRGSIKTDDEAYVIRDLAANTASEKELGEKTYNQLCEMIERYEFQGLRPLQPPKSRRSPHG